MKTLILTGFVIFLTYGNGFSLPDYIRSTTYNLNGLNDSLVTTSYISFGRTIQTKTSLGISKELVTAMFFDKAGRPIITTKPFIDSLTTGTYLPGDFATINTILKGCYSKYPSVNNNPYAYFEKKYYADLSGQVMVSGTPGINNRIGSGNEIRSWVLGTSGSYSGTITFPQGTVEIAGGLITEVSPNVSYTIVQLLDTLYSYNLHFTAGDFNFGSNAVNLLIVTQNQNGKINQILQDMKGNTVATFADPSDSSGDEILFKNRYDLAGRLLEQIGPNDPGPPWEILINRTKYRYNTLNQIIKKQTPDGAIDTLIYNTGGKLVNKLSYTINNSGNYVYHQRVSYIYDDLDRLEKVFNVATNGNGANLFSWNIYDRIDSLKNNQYGISVPLNIINQLENLNGKLVASVAFNWISGRANPVLDIYSYNDDGLVSKKFKIIPNLPVQEMIFFV